MPSEGRGNGASYLVRKLKRDARELAATRARVRRKEAYVKRLEAALPSPAERRARSIDGWWLSLRMAALACREAHGAVPDSFQPSNETGPDLRAILWTVAHHEEARTWWDELERLLATPGAEV